MTEKKERVLTEKEQARQARFEQTAAEMMEKGYRRVNLTVDIVKANMFALGMMIPVFIIGFLLFFRLHFCHMPPVYPSCFPRFSSRLLSLSMYRQLS